MSNLLTGTRIIDFTHVHVGPLCTYQLALMGAEVIKIESPDGGDMMRGMGAGSEPGMSPGFLGQSAGKRSVAVNLKSEAGLALVQRLIGGADAVVSNLRPGTADRLGIGYEAARSVNDSIVYCAISGYGQTGPESDRPAFDHLMQGESGMMDSTGTVDEPVRVGFAAIDAGTAVIASSALLAALVRRAHTGQGAYLDVSMLESAMALMGLNYYGFLATGQQRPRVGRNPLARSGSAGTFDTQDGVLLVNANTRRLFERMAHGLGRADLLADERFATAQAAHHNWLTLRGVFAELFRTNTAEHWDQVLRAAGVPSGTLKTPAEVLANPQLAHRGALTHLSGVPGIEDGKLDVLGAGFTVDGAPTAPSGVPPRLGEHTKEVLAELGLSEAALRELAQTEVIAGAGL